METPPRPEERLPPLNVGEKFLLGLWVFSNVAFVAAPLFGGYVGACLIYGFDAVRPGVAPWAALIMVGILVVWLVISDIVELILRRNMAQRHAVLREAVSTLSGVVILAALYGIVFTEAVPALVAAVFAGILLLACIPLVKLLEKRAPAEGAPPAT
ncbi:hypothetical protein Q2T94_01260 [Paeniglutamicibacter sulfureus]|uniref:hypothetical protein n=1 Tax=Paeniglutamicibacter sulfureus TaxID=43666 RepID=UPI002665D94D|nr:hypothetical protein [Paeniglutamicibacter sulfureus]MDO2932935.1 hypothetical protein [Paeniglutamicibacter sulfureus]